MNKPGIKSRIINIIFQIYDSNNDLLINEVNKRFITLEKQQINNTIESFIQLLKINVNSENFQKKPPLEKLYNKLVKKINILYKNKQLDELNNIFILLKKYAISYINKKSTINQDYINLILKIK